jgi:hypothetical protein
MSMPAIHFGISGSVNATTHPSRNIGRFTFARPENNIWRVGYWRAMCARSSASGSSMRSPLTSTVTVWIVPVNLNGLG